MFINLQTFQNIKFWRILERLKGKFYEGLVKSIMLYGR